MKFEKEVEVKSGKKTVAVIDIEIFESIAEAVDFFETDEKVIALINRAHKQSKSNTARTSSVAAARTPFEAIKRLSKTDDNVLSQLQSILDAANVDLSFAGGDDDDDNGGDGQQEEE